MKWLLLILFCLFISCEPKEYYCKLSYLDKNGEIVEQMRITDDERVARIFCIRCKAIEYSGDGTQCNCFCRKL